jgi:repressor LexA
VNQNAIPPSLTTPQRKVLDFIKGHHAQTGVYPTIREIQKWFEWKSPFAAQRHLLALYAKGALVRQPGAARFFTIP